MHQAWSKRVVGCPSTYTLVKNLETVKILFFDNLFMKGNNKNIASHLKSYLFNRRLRFI